MVSEFSHELPPPTGPTEPASCRAWGEVCALFVSVLVGARPHHMKEYAPS